MQTDLSKLWIALALAGALAGCASSGDPMMAGEADEAVEMAGAGMATTGADAAAMEGMEGMETEAAVMETEEMTADTAMADIAGGGLTDSLVQQLGISPSQASGGAGAIFSLARENLSPEQFGQIAAVVPGMDSLLGAAPALGVAGALPGGGGLPGLTGGGGTGGLAAGTLAGLAGPFSDLGLSPEMIGEFVPVIVDYLQSSGGASTAGLLRNALF